MTSASNDSARSSEGATPPDATLVHIRHLTKRFGDFTALDDVTVDVQRGEVFGFLGPNGAGKTTTIRMMLGLARPSGGSVAIAGHDVVRETRAALRSVSFVPGEFNVWPTLTGAEMLDLFGNVHGGHDAAFRAELCERFEFDPGRKGREYSKGNRQKIALIAALMVRPDLLVLDEPTGGLDPLMEMTFREVVREAKAAGQTVFLSSHILSEVEALCDRVGILRSGRLVDVGSLDDMRRFNAHDVAVSFTGAAPAELASLAGIDKLALDGNRATFQFQGSPDAILGELARHPIAHLEIREPSLEELFLTYYGAAEGEAKA